MRINRETLQKAARDLVAEHVSKDSSLLAVYLCGSTLDEESLLGDTGDIDLVFIHYEPAESEREIRRLNDQIHLDIAHHLHGTYDQPRLLRQHAWLGPTVFSCKILHDPQHFMDFTVAGVRGQFYLPENIYSRADSLIKEARQCWQMIALNPPALASNILNIYLDALEKAANAIVSLNGMPLGERRFLAEFPHWAEAAGQPGLAVGLIGLLGGLSLEKKLLTNWLPVWEAAYRALNVLPTTPAGLSPHRLLYYRAAIETWISGPQPVQALWPLLRTWTAIVSLLPDDNLHVSPWQDVCQYLSLTGSTFSQRVDALDTYLDTIEDTIEQWGDTHGIRPA
jgi:hypothetical protein